MKNESITRDRRTGAEFSCLKDRLRLMLPYAGIPIVTAALLALRLGRMDTFTLLMYVMIAIFGYVVAVTDVKSRLIPNDLIVSMFAAWAIVTTPMLFLDIDAAVTRLIESVIGFAVSGGLFLLVYLISKNGLGGGDVKLMAAVGLYLGFRGAVPAMLYGTVLAALTGLALVLLKKIGRKDRIPLAPFLYAGILITVFLS